MIDCENFTPWTALAGGALIGLASALFVLVNGRVAGISGIIAGLLQPKKGDAGMILFNWVDRTESPRHPISLLHLKWDDDSGKKGKAGR